MLFLSGKVNKIPSKGLLHFNSFDVHQGLTAWRLDETIWNHDKATGYLTKTSMNFSVAIIKFQICQSFHQYFFPLTNLKQLNNRTPFCFPPSFFKHVFSWEPKGSPPMPPPQEIRPYSGTINHWFPLIDCHDFYHVWKLPPGSIKLKTKSLFQGTGWLPGCLC